MSIGLIVDGQAEPDALWELRGKLQAGQSMIRPLYADLQPKAAPGQIARKALSRVKMLRHRSAEPIVLLIDREDQAECPPKLAGDIQDALTRLGEPDVLVVVRNRSFENWLIADVDGLASLRGRFRPTQTFRNRVVPNKADSVADGASLLNRICIGTTYHKRHDPPRILKASDVGAMAKNSRSFRRFLRLVGDKRYRAQSKRP